MGLLDRLRKKPPSPVDQDRLILRQLQGVGADLTRPRHVLYFLYFDDEAGARAAATAAEKAGYEASVTPPSEVVSQWSMQAESTRVVDYTNVAGFRALFERIAEENRGEYDGWEAAAKP
jgi:Regulator of ribonuclease activity B